MRAVHVLFYRPQPDDRWLNHLVTTINPPFSHCDIQFDDEVASSVYQNETVYMCKKSFSRLNYERLSFSVSESEFNAMYKFCEQSCRSMVRFDPLGMVGTFIPFYFLRPANRTFCSRYVCEALQASGRAEFQDLSPARTTPSDLHKKLSGQNKSFIHVGQKRLLSLKG